MNRTILVRLLLCFLWIASATPVWGGEVRIAVSANFAKPLREIAEFFHAQTGHRTIVSHGSSGKLYAQIRHGAPFDVFLSADTTHPRKLEADGLAVPDTRVTYAIGRLVLWSSDPSLLAADGPRILSSETFTYLAIANPKTAPYGQAAQHVLEALGLWERLQRRIVRGENIGQAFQFVVSRNAQLGFVARSQILDPDIAGLGSRWDVPPELHAPLLQQAILLKRGRNNEAAIAFLQFLTGAEARAVIRRFGYDLPQMDPIP
ncbi:MAG: molybdate ABC transporter substrate-binding protein [Nitrospirae bacterium]|nr:MAG: molybdate ABC transporter substrate-binding protein [Nitrospirota bacterium]